MWLGECGYVPGVDELMREEGIRFFFVDTHGVLFADPRPLYGVHAPIYCRSGVAAFGRDIESSKQVWSAQEGYPGDPTYRDFYRDIGFDLPIDYIKPYIHPAGIRTFTGHQVPRGHAPLDGQQAPVRPAPGVPARGRARGQLHVQPREAGRPPALEHGPPADRRRAVRRGALRALVVRGADVPRALLSQAPVRPGRRRADHAERLPARVPDQPGGHAVAVVVGREGLRRLLVQRQQRLGVPAPPQDGRAHGGARAPASRRARGSSGARSTRPRAR